MKNTFVAEFGFGDRVNIDNCKSLVAVIVGIRFFANSHVEYHLAWFHEGNHRTDTFDSWRLTGAE